MNKEQLAEKLNGNQYGDEIDGALSEQARASGLVVVYGASDDLMEFSGAINDEIGAFGGTTAYVTRDGLLEPCDCDCEHYQAAYKKATPITVVRGEGEWTWTFETKIPHATFEIYEDEEKFCKGIVFSLADVA